VVQDGRNQYVLKDSDRSVLKTTVAEAMTRRGVPVRWPLYDLKDSKALNVAEIRGGFKEPILNASKRYDTQTALAGSMIWNGNKWQSNWSLFVDGELRQWTMDDTDYKQLINKAVDQAADLLGVVFAIHNSDTNQQLPKLQIDIQAVNSIEKYHFIENYLGSLSAVDHIVPAMVEGQDAMFTVTLRSNVKDFLRLIKSDAELIEVRAPLLHLEPPPPAIQDNANTELVKVGDKLVPIDAGTDHKTPEQTSSEKTTSDQTAAQQVAADQTAAEKTEEVAVKQLPVYYYRLNQH
jgi:hypothetical protein